MTTPAIPSNVIREVPTPVVSTIDYPSPVRPPKPVVRGISPPVVGVPNPRVPSYPDLPRDTQIQFQEEAQQLQPPVVDIPPELIEEVEGDPPRQGLDTDTSEPGVPVPTTPVVSVPTVDVAGVEIPLPEPGPLVAAGSLAVVTTVVTLGSTIAVGQIKNLLEPYIKRLLKPKKKKIKIKQVKPVLHFIPNEDGTTEVIEYSQKGMKVLEGGIKKLEQYLRDQVEIDALWEYDNKVIIDEELGKTLTKEGQRRFKKYFAAPKIIAKKLGSKFAF